jgi:signal transduction histidine kinase
MKLNKKVLAADKVKKENRELREAVKKRTLELEQKNRDLEIEASLEKVRARAMAMQSSSELADLIALIQTELTRQDVNLMRSFIVLFDASGDSTWWMAGKGFGSLNRGYHMPCSDHPPQKAYFNGWRKRDSVWRYVLKGTIKKRWDNFIFKDTELAELPRMLVSGMRKVKTTFLVASFNKYGCISTGDPIPPAPSTVDLLVRFSGIFEQTYTRFLDLQKAERQTREAQIELSLERVRAKAMAMQSSTELADLIGMIHSEISRLDKNLDRSYIMLFDKSGGSTWWMSDDKNLSLKRGYKVPYHKHPPYLACLLGWRRRKEQWTYLLKGGVKKKWDEFIFRETELAQFPEMVKSHMAGAKVAYWSSSYNKYGCISTGSIAPLEKSSFKLMVRFSQMFEQTYTRFLDLQKAEAQTRESQVQLALERVRARTMAMQHSDELQEAANLLFKQVQSLEIPVWSCGYNIWEKHEKICTGWMSTNDITQPPFKIPLTESPTFIRFYKSRKKNEDFYVERVEGKALAAHYKYMFSLPDFATIGKEHLKSGFKLPKSQINHVANFAQGNLVFITSDHVPDAWDIFKRFAKVFEQTYTRFLDLKKAEAQAREAQIEAALEKVRSRSLAMHHTDELEHVVAELFNKLVDLNLTFDAALIYIFDKEKRNIRAWIASAILQVPVRIDLPFDDVMAKNQVIRDLWQATEKREDIFNRSYSGKAKNDYILFSHRHNKSNLAEATKNLMIGAKAWTVAFAAERNSVIGFDSWSGNITSEDDFRVLKRFSRVFEQAYTRFLDLQRAEAQAREAQIQLALERLRARTMAMHHSSELSEAATLVFEQLSQLGVVLWGCGFNICHEENVERWMSLPNGKMLDPLIIPYASDSSEQDFYDVWKRGDEIYTRAYEGEELFQGFESLKSRPSTEIIYQRFQEINLPLPKWMMHHIVPYKHGYLWIMVTKPFAETQIFVRFAKVFEQTYTRFLDLKNAEALARESQIQLALERVRARTMAMQKSDELKEVAMLLFKQVTDLGITCWTTGFNVWSEDGNSYVDYVTNPLGGFMEPYTVDTTRFSVFKEVSAARKKGETFFFSFETGERQKETYEYLQEFGDKDQFQKLLESGFQFPSQQVNHFVFGEKVSLLFITYDHVPEAHDIFKRFGKVFEQTYTRFLDLKKAEAQAREAQIEAALERVRSRTMAMHKSEELLDVITVVSEQLQHVGIKFGTVSFGKNSSSFDMDFWVAAPDMTSPIKMYAPYTDIPIYNRLKEAYRERRNYFSDTFTAEETKIWNQHFIDHNPELFSEKSRGYLTSRPGMTRTTVLLKNVFLFLINYDFVTYSKEEIEIVIRFAKVFEQTYTRFLDLQKAEAQAREAQIEAALERLRSRTMAMQRSTELAEVSQLLYKQFLSLGVHTMTCAFMFPDEEKKLQSGWTVLPDGTLLPRLLDFPLVGDATLDERYRSWKEKSPLHQKLLHAEENRRHHQFLSEQVASHISKDIFTQLPDQITFTSANFSQGYLMIITAQQLGAEEENILVRFAKVFEQTYTRFLDLQKAEEQAREAQIESALEKIRGRSLAMHHSGELKDVVAIMFEKMKELNVVIGTIAIQLFDENTMNCIFWAGNNLHNEPPRVKLPYYEKMLEEDGYMKDSWECKKKGENLINKVYTFEQKARFFDYVFASNDLATIPEADRDVIRQSVIRPAGCHIVCLINEKNSSVFADSWNGEFYSEESIKVLTRAAKVFEQAYVRFLDLQKAEAQAREAQIEAALERVRARTMAMHKSEELLDVIVVVSQQLSHLDFRFDVVSFARNSEMHDYRFWFCLEKAQQAHEIHVPYLDNPMFERIKGVMARGEKFFADTLTVAENREWIEHMLAHDRWPDLTNDVRDYLLNRGYARSIVFMPQIMLTLGNYLQKAYSEEQNNILKRFAAVFEQSYTRFLDLQKAEDQAREAQIEAALERVRAKAMAMHTAEQLKEVVHELRKQMGLLGQKDLNTCVIHLNDESPEFIMAWAAIRPPDRNDEIREFNIKVPKQGLTIIEEALKEYGANRQDYVLLTEGEKSNQWMEFMKNVLPEVFTLAQGSSYDFTAKSFWSFADFQGGSLIMITFESPDENSRALLRRFANVFGLAYRRFADLKQAEAQAREAQIEVALERVRAKAMAMHTAEQLKEVVHELRKQMGLLGQKDLETCVIHLIDESPDFVESFAATRLPNRSDEIHEFHVMIPKRGLKIIEESIEAYGANRRDYVMINDGAKLDQWMEFIRESSQAAYSLLIESVNSNDQDVKRRAYWSLADFQGGSLIMVTLETPDENSRALLRRFSNVFGLAYRRFADLKQAEAQAREATIEAAVEKIRSRSLGMHKSEEILDVVAILFEKLKELGLVFDGGAAIHLFSEGSRDATIWVTASQQERPVVVNLPYDEADFEDNPIILDIWRARETGESITNKHYPFEQKNRYFQYVFKHNPATPPMEVQKFILDTNSYTATFIYEKNSLLGANSWTEQKFSDDDVEVLKRVARVFEQAYVRFLDLQRAEAQAKEATIEAALEKIRSRSLGMHQSHELNDVVKILFEKLKELDLPFDGGAGLFLFSEGSRDTSFWVTNGYVPPVCNYLPYDESDFPDNVIMQDIWKAKDTGEPIVNKQYSSEEKNKLFSYTSKHNDETKISEAERKRVFEASSYTATFIPERNSLLSVDSWSKQKMSAGDVEVLKRVARVFEQAYVRFLDLQKAEVHAKEAVCLASLDRVRAEIASMRTVEDLDRITPLIWRELNTIGIPFIRCGVFIMDESNQVVHNFLSTPDGKAIAVFQLPFDAPGSLGSIVKHWQDKKIYTDYWDKVALKGIGDTLVGRGIFSSTQQYLDTLPKEGFYPYCLPFAQGMLYVGNLTQLKGEELTLLQSLADAFATAYARYDDFNKLEAAKQQVDRTLVDLKQAQQQLVQSEKMASLGELTAGIAHEIQNPLNFVNNFSEVSNELIDEMKTELAAGNLKDAAELAESIKQNLEKITHHGKRADGIVKGMLQHSRAGSGQKEPTDINFLCDEYLRLAYHGYRAKEKSFNAKFESSFDPTLPKVNVVGQDIGRVILNLINNAFYAVTEMKRQNVDGYEPIVSVITKNLSGKVEIRVKDNGIGISEKVLEKIFQPFFTTKPTGQGTGLGLSLSYDIIKAHGGTLEVSSIQGEGSEFVIQLPT